MASSRSERRGTPGRGARRSRRPRVEALEERRLLAAPFSVGGDPSVDPADFRVTTFAEGLNYPHGLQSLSDGSMLVAVNNPNDGGASIFNTTGQLLRFTDADHDGVADGPGTVLYDGLPGPVTAVQQAGRFILVTSSEVGSERISFLRVGGTPAAPLTLAGTLDFHFPSASWLHTTFALAVRPTPRQPGNYDFFFNIGSEFNGVEIGGDGQVVLDSNGDPTYQPTVHNVRTGGLLSTTLNGDSIYMATLRNVRGTPRLANLQQIASGLRNAASLAIDPATGDLWLADNGIDGNNYSNEAWSTDDLNVIPSAQIGGDVEYFGFPRKVGDQIETSYVKAVDRPGDPVTVVNPGVGVQPVAAYQPIPDASAGAEGSQSEGASGFAMAPPGFPAGLNHGVFVGFHGKFNQGGIANEENPLLFTDASTGRYFNFVGNDLDNIGHLDEITSTADSLFVADLSSSGRVFGSDGLGAGKIYQIQAIAPSAASAGAGAAFMARLGDGPGAMRSAQRTGTLNEAGSESSTPFASREPRRAGAPVRSSVARPRPTRSPRAQGGLLGSTAHPLRELLVNQRLVDAFRPRTRLA